jgi:propionyl-CoA synthetase
MQPDGKKLEELEPNQLGRILLKLPLPPGNMSTLYRNDDLFEKVYFTRFPGYYDTMVIFDFHLMGGGSLIIDVVGTN